MKTSRIARPAGAALLLLALPGTLLLAATTGLWMTATAEDFARGKLENVTILSTGQLAPGMGAERLKIDEISIWATAFAPDGTAYVGTGNNGRVYRVTDKGVEKAFETDEAVVTSLAWAGGELYAGTLPSGRIYAWKPGGAPRRAAELPVPYIWKMLYHAGLKSLVIGTGPEGQVFTLAPGDKEARVFYDSNESHVLSLAEGDDGAIWAGTSVRGVLYKFSPQGKVLGAWDLEDSEIRALSFRDGSLYIGGNRIQSYQRNIYFMGRDDMLQDRSQFAQLLAARISQLGKGEEAVEKGFQELFEASIYRLAPGGDLHRILGIPKRYICDIGVEDSGVVYAATADEGELWAASEPNLGWVVMDLKEAQILSLGMHEGQLRLVGTANAAALYRTSRGAARSAQFTSKVKDTGFHSTWGSIEWKSTGPIEVLTRTGDHAVPDPTWSEWSAPLEKSGGRISSPAARFIQFRLRWKEGTDSKVDWVRLAYLNDNQRPNIEQLAISQFSDAFPAAKGVPDAKEEYNQRQMEEARGKVRVQWKASDPDGDNLIYWLYYRREGDREWVIINPKEPVRGNAEFFRFEPMFRGRMVPEMIQRQQDVGYEWKTTNLADGWYMLKVVASDECDNAADPKRVWKEAGPILVDSSKPEVAELAEAGKLAWKGTAVDGTSHIARIEYNLDGEKWEMVAAADGLYDSGKEAFKIELRKAMPGEHVLTVRAIDEGGNVGMRQMGFKVEDR